MKKYKIESICTLGGAPRTDGKHPQRVGSLVTMLEVAISRPLTYAYITDKDGQLKEGSFTGNIIKELRTDEKTGDIEAVTQDCIFKFTAIGEYDGGNHYVDKLLADEELKTSITRTGVDDITCIDLDTLLKEIK